MRALAPSRWAAVLAVLTGGLVPIAVGPGVACAGDGDRAALVIDTGEEETRLCVELDDDDVTGLELIVLAGEQHDLDFHLGFGGQAVCMLAGVGPTGDDCFAEYPNFWGYWRGAEAGGWTWSATGAGASTVEDGDVEGWAWGSGDGPDDHPEPPPTEFSEVCKVANPSPTEPPDTSPEPEASAAASPSPSPPPGQPPGRPGDRSARARPPSAPSAERDRRWHDGVLAAELAPEVVATPSLSPSPTPSTQPEDLAFEASADRGPPPAGVAAIAAALALIAAGTFVTVKRRS